METYVEYDQRSDIDFYSRHQDHDHSPQLLQQQAPLPSFKDIIPPHLHTAIDPQQQGHQAVVEASSEIYTPASQALSSAPRSIATSPAQSHKSSMPSLPEHFEDVSVRANETMFTPQSQSMTTIDRGSSWIPTSQYHMSTSFTQPTPRMTQMGSQQLNSRTSPSSSLPPLSDINRRSSTFDQTYATTSGQMTYVTQAASYPQLYSQTPQTTTDIDGNSFARSMSYDGTSYARFNSYPQTTRSYPTTDYSRFGTASYDPYRYNTGYRTTYSDLGYSPHIVGSQPATFGVPGDLSGAHSRRRRGNLPKPVTDILRSWFHEHLDHPYPSEEDKQMFISKTGLTISQISNWFINARRRHWPALRQNRERARNTSALRRSNSAGASI